jgi:hypothetical protein
MVGACLVPVIAASMQCCWQLAGSVQAMLRFHAPALFGYKHRTHCFFAHYPTRPHPTHPNNILNPPQLQRAVADAVRVLLLWLPESPSLIVGWQALARKAWARSSIAEVWQQGTNDTL